MESAYSAREDVPDDESVQIRDSIPVPESASPRLELWGRVWGSDAELGFAFYGCVNPEEGTVEDCLFMSHRSVQGQDSYHPGKPPETFRKNIQQALVSAESVPRQLISGTRDRFQKFIETDSSLERLLSEQDGEGFQAWGDRLAQSLLEAKVARFQLHGRVIPEDQRDASIQSLREEAFQGSSRGSKPRFPVTFLNDPVHGRRAKNLTAGTEVLVRVTGPIVEKLSENHIDRSQDPPVSVPTRATVRWVRPASSGDSDGSSSGELLRLEVSVGDSVRGQGKVYGENRIRLAQSRADKPLTNQRTQYKRIAMFVGMIFLISVELGVFLWFLI